MDALDTAFRSYVQLEHPADEAFAAYWIAGHPSRVPSADGRLAQG